jgi:hypothetical protein
MGIGVLLIAMILMGLITDKDKGLATYIWFGIGAVIFLFVLFGALSDAYWFGGFGFMDSLPILITVLIVVGAMAWVIMGSGKKKE